VKVDRNHGGDAGADRDRGAGAAVNEVVLIGVTPISQIRRKFMPITTGGWPIQIKVAAGHFAPRQVTKATGQRMAKHIGEGGASRGDE
jgi:hypothetical protein